MKTLKKLSFALCLASSLSINSFAADVSNPAQLEITPPAADGALKPDKTQPITMPQAAAPTATQATPGQPAAAPQQLQVEQTTTTSTTTTSAK
jgi:hypothetical protein